MGKKSILNRFKKKENKEQKDLQNRADQFMQEYRIIRARYQCDFQAFLRMIDGGQGGIVPALRIIDATKQIEKEEEEAEKVKAEAEKNEAIKPNG